MRREYSRSTRFAEITGRTTTRRSSRQAIKKGNSRIPKVVALAVAMIMGFALFYISPVFRISHVTVVGAAAVAADKVAQTADVDGQNILAVDRNQVARAVGQIPVVKSARVTRILPNELVIAIEERKPWAVWQVKDAKYVIDDEGVVIGTSAPQGLVTIVDTGGQSIKLGSRVEPTTVELARRLTELLPKQVGVLPKRFEYSADAGLVVVTDKGWQARFGDLSNLDYKMATLKGIVSAATERKSKLDVIDLRYTGRPFYR